MKHLKKIILTVLLFTTIVYSQNGYFERGLSAKIGIGTIKSNSPVVSSLTLGIAYKSTFGILPLPIKFEYQLHKRIEYFLPGEYYDQVYPYLQTLSISAVIPQSLSEHWGLDFDLGYVLIHDRVFDNSDTFSNGFNFDMAIRYYINRWAYRIGLNYGLGVTQHNPSFMNYYLSIRYGI